MSYGRAPRRRFTLLAAPAAAVALALTLTACSGDDNKTGGGGNTHFVTGSGGISTVAKADREAAPKLDGETLDGKQLDVADYKGKVVVLNVWGSWCGPCRLEAQYFAKVAKETQGKGVEFIGINTRDAAKGPAISFEKDYGVTYPSFFDPTGKLMLRFPKGTLRPQAIPSTVVLDRDGKIAARYLTALDATKLHQMIDPLIAEK
ncbi:TlpA family protein disulfide reductase [Streptomyces sp. NBC_01217]|uniref:TlpA family protein disulfide reductase n=1 Tax=Streptomyces sp. NBC_01217 TaxID=2903779 RepID=UPI002E15A51C|nr:TlpA family protein disulfide reductase [Streptomyces sp. NBC_01217]